MKKKVQQPARRKFLAQAGLVGAGLSLGTSPIVSAVERALNKSTQDSIDAPSSIMMGYMWTFGDIGGTAITIGLANLLKENFPEYQIIQFGSGEELQAYTKEKFPDSVVLDDDIRKGPAYMEALEMVKKDFGGELPELSHEIADYALTTFSEYYVNALKKHNPAFYKAMAESDLFIYPSGMMINYGEITLAGMDFWHHTIGWSLPILAARKMGTPYGVYGQSITAVEGSAAVHYFDTMLEGAEFVTCRDGNSVEYLKSLGITPHGLMFVPDSTVSFNYRDDEWGKKFMQQKGLKSKEFLVVIPRTWPRRSMITQFIGKERSKRHVNRLTTIIEDWVNKTGMKVLIGAEVHAQMPYHKTVVYDALPEDIKPHCEVIDEFWLPEQAAAIYHNARILLVMDFHSFYMAIPEGTPCVGAMTRESGRKIWSFRDFKLGEYMFDIDTTATETIEDAIFYIHYHYEQESHRIQSEVIPHLREREDMQMKLIAEALNDY